jgi:DNA-binding transcriptional MerR regulator
MPDDPYSLADLARLADVTPRTIRYYVAQGLLPSPEAAGPATRYTEGHLLRLRLIRRLQRDHLPLAEIRARLERMGDEAIAATLDAAGPSAAAPPTGTAETLAYVRSLMTKAGVAPRFYDQPRPSLARRVAEPAAAGATFEPSVPDGFPIREAPGPSPAPAPAAPAIPAIGPLVITPGPRHTTGDRSTWERVSISPDVEVHVRRPLDRRANKLVERLVRIARELFDEET